MDRTTPVHTTEQIAGTHACVGPVHHVDHGGSGPTMMMVHGLGGSAMNWASLAPLLTDRAHVHALDLAGHGATPRDGRRSTVWANAGLLTAFVEQVLGSPVVLVGNSMGGMICLLVAHRRPDLVAGLVLLDPAIPGTVAPRLDPMVLAGFAVTAIPGLGSRAMSRRTRSLTPEQQVMQTLNLCTVDRHRVDPEVVRSMIDQAARRREDPDNEVAFLQASRSVVATVGRRRPLLRAMESVAAPVLLVQGVQDRLVDVSAARRAAQRHPSWTYVELDDCGHVPMLEHPATTASAITDWLDGAGQQAAEDAVTG